MWQTLTFWGKFWAIWAAGLFSLIALFLIFEGLAFLRGLPGDTLSEQVWWLRNHGHPLYYIILDVCILGAIALSWAAWHFIWQGPKA